MGRVRESGLLLARMGLVLLVGALLFSPLSGIAGEDGGSGGYPPPDTVRPLVDPGDGSLGTMTDLRVLTASPWMSML